MDYDQIGYTLENHPSIKLLRLGTAPLIISFIYDQFKQSHRITIPQRELVEKLEDYLELLREYSQANPYPRPATEYLDTWCNEHQFLRKYYEENSDEPVFELTPATEKAIGWLEDLSKSEFIGTESRFLRIFTLLQEIVVKSTEDVEARLAQLEKQKAAIQQEIETIRQTGRVERYSAGEIRERFFEANEAIRRLLADFREVEQNFREITRQVQEQQLELGIRKGDVVAKVLDADAALKESDQGRSFYAFWEFLTLRDKQDELQANLEAVYNLPELQPIGEEHQSLRRIKRSLLEAGTKIIQSNYRLAEQLRRLLDEQYLAESRRVAELAKEIKRLALAVVENPPDDPAFIELEGEPEVQLAMERPLWEAPVIPDFNSQNLDMGDDDPGRANLAELYSQVYVDETRLRRQIDSLLIRQAQVTLAELSEHYPIRQGLPEVVAYFALVAREKKHQINDQVQEQVLLFNGHEDGQQPRRLVLPQIIFRR